MVKKAGINVKERDGTLLKHEELAADDDFLHCGGISFEGSDDYITEKVGGIIKCTIPDYSIKPTITADLITTVEYYNGTVQTVPNRIARGAMTYDVDENLTQEFWEIFDLADGTTSLRDITIVHTWVGDDLTKSEIFEV